MSLVSEYQQNTSQHWPGSLGGILDKCAWYWQTAMHLDGPSTICSDVIKWKYLPDLSALRHRLDTHITNFYGSFSLSLESFVLFSPPFNSIDACWKTASSIIIERNAALTHLIVGVCKEGQ